MRDHARAPGTGSAISPVDAVGPSIGKHSLVESVQRAPGAGSAQTGDAGVHTAAAHGVSGASGALPHLDAIQRSFGRHDVSGIQAHTDGAAAQGAGAMGARAFASGNHVAFAGAADLHTAAHEAAHVVQQRGGVQLKGGVGAAGDTYEQHADAVADRVVRGESAESLLDAHAGSGGAPAVQREKAKTETAPEAAELIERIIRNDLPAYARDLNVNMPPPGALLQFLERITTVGPDAALEAFLRSDLVPVPPQHEPFASGAKRGQARKFVDPEVSEFFANLFHAVAVAANQQGERQEQSIKLHPHDLFHAHMTPYVGKADKDGRQSEDLVMVFHAKEYPSDMREAKQRQVGQSWGATAGSKSKDGRDISSHDHEHRLRNFIYLVKAQRLIALDPQKGMTRAYLDTNTWEDHPGLIDGNSAAETLKEDSFNATKSENVDINYFPSRQDRAEPDEVYAGPTKTEGMSATHFLRSATTPQQLLEWINDFSQDELQVAFSTVDSQSAYAGVPAAAVRQMLQQKHGGGRAVLPSSGSASPPSTSTAQQPQWSREVLDAQSQLADMGFVVDPQRVDQLLTQHRGDINGVINALL